MDGWFAYRTADMLFYTKRPIAQHDGPRQYSSVIPNPDQLPWTDQMKHAHAVVR